MTYCDLAIHTANFSQCVLCAELCTGRDGDLRLPQGAPTLFKKAWAVSVTSTGEGQMLGPRKVLWTRDRAEEDLLGLLARGLGNGQ